MIFIVKLAGQRIQIHSVYPELKDFFKDYIVEGEAYDFSVSWTKEDILAEQEYSEEKNFPLTYLETLAALRKISDILPTRQRFLMHGASITYNDKAYLFTAISGTGKSTHISLWRKHLGEAVQIVNGDKPFLSIGEPDATGHRPVHIYGTPWAGKENWQKNRSAQLNGNCFLCRGTTNTIRKIEPAECLSLLMKQVYIPAYTEAAGCTLDLLDLLVTNVPLYILECDISEDAVRCSFEAMTGLKYPNA